VKELAFHRLFSMSAFEGLRLLRKESLNNPNLDIKDIPGLLVLLYPIAATLDIEAALSLHTIVDNKVSYGGVEFYRECISAVITTSYPTWAKLITLGRKRFIQKLGSDEFRDIKSLFRQARLLDDPPTMLDIEWWDIVSGRLRLEGDRLKLQRARIAEELSLNYERQKLLQQGIHEEPKWMAIDDNTAGYDVLSYEKGEFGLINKLIEVKSTIASPLRFYITRNEWAHALEVGDAYIFHIWNLQPDKPFLYIRKTSDIAPHIPQDNKKGKWTIVEVPVSSI